MVVVLDLAWPTSFARELETFFRVEPVLLLTVRRGVVSGIDVAV